MYENEELKITVKKAAHIQEKKFRLQDHMFHLKVETKKKGTPPLLSSILKFLHLGFLFILNNIKKFYKSEDSNIAFMTLIQSPMVNAINTGGFLLHDNIGPTEMVDRLLSLLNQYLVSNKTLQLNKTFKVYLKILSSEHSKIKKVEKNKKIKIGCSETTIRAFWAIDIPPFELYHNACILLTTILALAQHTYFISNGREKKFKYLEKILSKNVKKYKYAKKLFYTELDQMFLETNIQPQIEPYSLFETIKILSNHYKCQYFIFEGSMKTSQKLFLRYPEAYDSSLKPVFLYKPYGSNHVIFIRNLSSYFKSNGKTCFICKRYFKSKYPHFCKTNNETCFVCHRYLQKPETFITSNLQIFFCDSKLKKDANEKCNLCNVLLVSKECKKGHRRLCNSKGCGYFCDSCKRFTYSSSHSNSKMLKENHECSDRICKVCFRPKGENHLCKLILEKYPKTRTKLGFIYFEICEFTPFVCNLFVENVELKQFDNILIAERGLQLHNNFQPESLNFDFILKYQIKVETPKKPTKPSQDVLLIQKRLTKMDDSFQKEFMKTLFDDRIYGTTFIVGEENGSTMVIF